MYLKLGRTGMVQTQDISILWPIHYHYATVLPLFKLQHFHRIHKENNNLTSLCSFVTCNDVKASSALFCQCTALVNLGISGAASFSRISCFLAIGFSLGGSSGAGTRAGAGGALMAPFEIGAWAGRAGGTDC